MRGSIELKIAEDVMLPIDTVTQRIGIFGVSGSGKTYTASVLAEEMLRANAHVIVLDPLGVWWGLRVTDALATTPIYILGGDHADLPLDPSAGAAIADLVVEEHLSVILDLSHWEQEQQASFAASFARQLYQRNRDPLHCIVDEADIFASETPGTSAEWECRRAWDTIVRRGRVRGLGVTVLSQRPAVVAKNLLTQTGTLIVHRIASPQDQKAIDIWFRAHGADEQRKQVLISLASLPVGEAWIWSPSDLSIFERATIRTRATYDSSATPKVGDTRRDPPKRLADVDLAVLRDRLQVWVHQAEENDPVKLRVRISDLERQLRERVSEQVTIIEEKVVERIIERSVLTDDARKLLQEAMDTASSLGKELGAFHALLGQLASYPTTDRATISTNSPSMRLNPTPVIPQEVPQVTTLDKVPTIVLKKGEQRILDTLARHPKQRLSHAQIGTLTQLTPGGGTYHKYLTHLRQIGLVTTVENSLLQITQLGMNALGRQIPPEPRTASEVLALWQPALRKREFDILEYVVKLHPQEVTLGELSTHFGLTSTGGAFNAYIGNLRRNGLITVRRGVATMGPAIPDS